MKATVSLFLILGFLIPAIPCLGQSRSVEDGRAWMEVTRDGEDLFLIGHVCNTVDTVADTLARGHEMLGVNPTGVYAIEGTDGDIRFLFVYSRGNIFFWDEAVIYIAGKDGSVRRGVFRVEDTRPDEVDVMWWDPRVDACEGFPPDLEGYPDPEKHGIRFDAASKRLYVPVMDCHEDDEFSGCPIYTGRYSILEFNGSEFVYIGDE